MPSSTRLVGPAIGLVILAIGVLAIIGLLRITSAQDAVTTTTTGGTPTAVSLAPAESWSCILDQPTLTARLTNDGGAVGNGRIEFTLNRFPQAVGDIVEVGGNGQSKRTNTFAVVQTSSGGEATATLVATRPGDTDVTAFAPGVLDASTHKAFGVVHWVDGCPAFPANAENPVGEPHPMSVSVLRVSDGSPVEGTSVRWTITDDGPNAQFAGASGDGNSVTVATDASGESSVTLQQVSEDIGTNAVLIEVLSEDGETMFAHTMVKQWTSPILEVAAAGPATVGLLSEATYNLTVTNSGDSSATNTMLTVELASGLRFVSATGGGVLGGTATAPEATWSLGTLDEGESVTVTLTAQAEETGLQTNIANVTSAEGLSDSDSVVTVVTPGGLEVTKTGPATAQIGSQVTYSIRVLGTGTGASTGVTLVDTVPGGMSFVSSSVPSTVAEDQVTLSLGTLNPTDSTTVEIVLQADEAGEWTNTVDVTSVEGALANGEATTRVVEPTLTIEKAGPETAVLNAEFDYTITVANVGEGVATSPVVTDTLPAGLEYVSSVPSGTVSGSTVTWNLDDMAADASETITLRVRGVTASELENTVSVSFGGSDFEPEASATTNILASGISLVKTGRTAIFVGSQATYTLKVTNDGDVPLTGVTITENIPDGLSYVSSSPAGTVSADGDQVTWNIAGELAVDAEVSVTVTLRSDQEGTATNTASVTSAEGAADPAALTITSLPAPGASIQITDSVDPVEEGELVSFTVRVSNQGRSAMTGVQVVVPIPAALSITAVSDGQASISADGSTVTFALSGSLLTGQSFSFTITARANELPAGEIRVDTVTTATLSYDQFSTDVSADQGTTVIGQ